MKKQQTVTVRVYAKDWKKLKLMAVRRDVKAIEMFERVVAQALMPQIV